MTFATEQTSAEDHERYEHQQGGAKRRAATIHAGHKVASRFGTLAGRGAHHRLGNIRSSRKLLYCHEFRIAARRRYTAKKFAAVILAAHVAVGTGQSDKTRIHQESAQRNDVRT
jgi:hypothetical protein